MFPQPSWKDNTSSGTVRALAPSQQKDHPRPRTSVQSRPHKRRFRPRQPGLRLLRKQWIPPLWSVHADVVPRERRQVLLAKQTYPSQPSTVDDGSDGRKSKSRICNLQEHSHLGVTRCEEAPKSYCKKSPFSPPRAKRQLGLLTGGARVPALKRPRRKLTRYQNVTRCLCHPIAFAN